MFAERLSRAWKERRGATNSSSFIGSSSGESPASADFQSGADTTENAPTENVPQSSAYPPQPEVNPNSVTEVAQRPFESVHACTLARADCINAAFEASGGAANDNSRFVDMKNCNDA